ncbi:hypothetical protein [Aquimarina sp. AU474]|uniref:hypothetical protein n=1 Tax=Aquimarina sp. AU474 TaxID=2108529 RepID=UPI000D692BBA|nr:hypothetical protein [Aquimarina sp. AU474]
MLKGKKGLYILLPLVVFIWGAIIYQVTDAFSDDDPLATDSTAITFSKIEGKERDHFLISSVTRDPFLGTMYKPKKEPVKKITPRVKKPEVTWPSVTYKGMVTGNPVIYLIEINGTDQLMQRNEVVSDIKLIKASSSWVQLRFKGEAKRFEILN